MKGGVIQTMGVHVLMALLSACGNKHEIPESPQLQTSENTETFEASLKKAISLQGSDAIAVDVFTSVDSANSSFGDSGVYSGTNVQVQGVDEADLMKSDGRYLFVGAPLDDWSYYSTPFEDDSGGSANSTQNEVRILALQENPAAAQEVYTLSLGDDTDPRLQGLYLTLDGQGQAETLITVSSDNADYGGYWFAYNYWQQGKILVQFFDVSNPTRPTLLHRMEMEGRMVASRRIDGQLILVNRYAPFIEGYDYYPQDETQRQANEQLLEATTLAELMPDVQVDDGQALELLDVQDCYLPPVSGDEQLRADLVTLSVVDIEQPSQINSRCFMGGTEAVYVSTQAAYMASSRYQYQWGGAEVSNNALVYETNYQTDIHKFRFEGATSVYRGSVAVEGHLGWQQDKKQYRMGESDDRLVVVTSVGESWDNTATTQLHVMEDVARFAHLAQLPNERRSDAIGKPGELLYAANILGDRAYLVTFRVTDPLYVIDLSEPTDPYIAGELEIQGYSDYLYPLADGLLLGVGKDAIPDEGEGDSRGAWYQGVKLSLFDVADMNWPRELGNIVLGKRGSESAALYDHHAISILPMQGSGGTDYRIALPMQINETTNEWADYSQPWAYYDWTHSGLYLFNVDSVSRTLSRQGSMVVEQASLDKHSHFYGGSERALLTEQAVHYVHNTNVWSAAWDSPEVIKGPQ